MNLIESYRVLLHDIPNLLWLSNDAVAPFVVGQITLPEQLFSFCCVAISSCSESSTQAKSPPKKFAR